GDYNLHPALLDAALHALLINTNDQLRLPFSWNGLHVNTRATTSLRVHLTSTGEQVSLAAVDENGAPAFTLDGLLVRPLPSGALGAEPTDRGTGLYEIEWTPVEAPTDPTAAPPDLDIAHINGEDLRAVLHQTLTLLQNAIDDDTKSSPLVIVTRGAVAAAPHDNPDPTTAAIWGLVRSAQAEHPHRFVLIDLPNDGRDHNDLLSHALTIADTEPQIAARPTQLHIPRLRRINHLQTLPHERAWSLQVARPGSLEGLALLPNNAAQRPLTGTEVRVAVHAAGVNFIDVVITLGMFPGQAPPLGSEGAGVVIEVGPDVEGLSPGERVMGLIPGAYGPLAVSDHRMLAKIPEGWSFTQAATVSLVFLTAHYGLVDLAELQAGERVLVHSGAGGVGMAAIQIAQRLGCEVFATASEAKWPVLRELGLDDAHIASSRTLEFGTRFPRVDVVLNALAGEFVDTSLSLLGAGGRFLEMEPVTNSV
ncbi:hypothetical protein BST28_22800, partial [Mycolicibacter kumamotonensis]